MRTSIALIALAVGLAVTLAASAGVRRAPPAFPRNFYAAWSPDGKRIAFASDRAGTKDIYVMNADGTHQRAVVASPGDEWSPTWSPDGTRLAFVSDRDGRPHIYSVQLSSGSVTQLTSATADDQWPDWGRTGEIVFSRWSDDSDSDDRGKQACVLPLHF